MVAAARQEAQAAFGDNAVYLEPLVQRARHIEVQILGDGRGQVLCLGERECSIQRRRQKLIEEAPAPNLSRAMRKELHAAAIRLGRSLKYRSLGTVEFLLDHEGKYYFIEVNPRIQVEHPVTELVTGIDLVRAQLESGRKRSVEITPGTYQPARLGDRGPRAGGGSRTGFPAGDWRDHPSAGTRRTWHPAGQRSVPGDAGRGELQFTDRQSDRLGGRSPGGHPSPAARPGRLPDRRDPHRYRFPDRRCWRARATRTAGRTRPTWIPSS